MNRIDATFASLKAAGRTALIPYVTAGDPSLAAMPALLDALTAAGADVIELGVPFSDPMADGPVIQRASERALAQHVGLADVLVLVRDFRRSNRSTPIVLMGYANPIEAMGETVFADRAAEAGVDGVLVVDYPPEEAREFAVLLRARDIAPIFLLSPTTPETRIAAVASLARGYVYYVSLKGVTGAGHLDTSDVARKLLEIRRHVRLPVGVEHGRLGRDLHVLGERGEDVAVPRLLHEREGLLRVERHHFLAGWSARHTRSARSGMSR